MLLAMNLLLYQLFPTIQDCCLVVVDPHHTSRLAVLFVNQ
jgi:hypothetical protein